MNNIKRVYGQIGNFTIIERDTEFMPFVAAYLYDDYEKTWAQGKYFHDFEDACNYAITGQNIMSGRRLTEIASQALDWIAWENSELEEFDDNYDLEITEDEREFFNIPQRG